MTGYLVAKSPYMTTHKGTLLDMPYHNILRLPASLLHLAPGVFAPEVEGEALQLGWLLVPCFGILMLAFRTL